MSMRYGSILTGLFFTQALMATPSAEPKALAQLHDIHLPPPISWWPLAPGWYLLFVMCLTLFTLGLIWIIYRHHRGIAKRQALILLNAYEKQFELDRQSPVAAARVSELLKRVALVYYPRHQVAKLHGQDWLIFLNNTSPNLSFQDVGFELLQLPYAPMSQDTFRIKELFRLAHVWIAARRVPCSN